MRYVKCTVVNDYDFGGSGILPNIFKNWENYSPAIAVGGLAHDLLEHGCRETGTFHQEVAATGGYLFTRLLTGHINSHWSHAHNAASNMCQTWFESTNEGYFPPAPKVIILDRDSRELLDDFFVELKPELEKEWNSDYTDSYGSDEDPPPCPYTTQENWPHMKGWIKYGYARAYKRFKGDDWLAFRLFNNINQEIENIWREIENNIGETFTLMLDYETGNVRIKREWEDY